MVVYDELKKTGCRFGMKAMLIPRIAALVVAILVLRSYHLSNEMMHLATQHRQYHHRDTSVIIDNNVLRINNNNNNNRHVINHNASDHHADPLRQGETFRPYYRNSTMEVAYSFGGVRARSFAPWKRYTDGKDADDDDTDSLVPCLQPEDTWIQYATQKTRTRDGLLFLKTYKTGSSTASGINLRIARNVARRDATGYDVCKTRFIHAWASSLYGPKLNRDETFLWTIVRDPVSRTVSQLFHFHVSRGNQSTADESLIARIRRDVNMNCNYYISSLALQKFRPQQHDPVAVANQILADYNFVAITERMDESAVALAMLLHIPLGDVLFLKAKLHGSMDAGGDGGVCTYITPSFVSKGMEAYFRSDEYQDMVQWDHLLYQAANKSLDLTIDALGRDEFHRNLLRFQRAQELATQRCLPNTRFPCSPTGKINKETDCLWKDSGCGYKCLDDIATELDLWH